MKLRVRLFDGSLTLQQQLITLLWGALLVAVVLIWATTSLSLIGQGLSQTLLSIGQLLGLIATYAALTQFMLMGRIAWIEGAFGLDRLASFHRLNGYVALLSLIAHAVLIVASFSIASGRNYFAEYISTIQNYEDVLWAVIAQVLFIAVVGSSIYIARKRLSFENWYYVHLMAYAAIVLASLHQFEVGSAFLASPAARYFWYGLYGFVALNLLIWRFGAIVYNAYRYDFRVARVVKETPTTTSVYIEASKANLASFQVKPGQFVLVRILTKGRWWQEHPFTVSWVPKDNQLRLTIRNSGDFTAEIPTLEKGAKVLVAGPFGRFTSDVMVTEKQLLIAGGVGITPIRSLLEQAVENGTDTVVLYANKDDQDVPLRKEIDTLAKARSVKLTYVYSDIPAKDGAISGRIDGKLITTLVKDYASRDIYVCGPPPMMAGIVNDLEQLGVGSEQLHYEVFALHP